MTVSTTSNRITYTGNGVSTVFAFPYKFIATSDIVVYVNGVLQSSGYTVGTPSDTGANITFSVAPASSAAIVILSDPARTQGSSLPSTGPFPAKTVETMADKLTLLVQRLYDLTARSLTLSDGDASTASTVLPSPSASALIGWDAAAAALKNYDASALGITIAYSAWKTSVFNGTGAQTAFVLASDAGVASNCDVTVGGVSQTPDVNFSYSSTTKTITFLTGAPPAGTGNIVVRYGQALPVGTVTSGNVTDSTAVGRSLLTAADAATARAAIGAGTALAGANNDITSLGALSAIPSIVQQYVQQVKGISASVASNALTITASPLSLDFRSTTLGSGTVSTVSGTPANLVVPSSATLGTVNATQSRLAVLALNNAGTIELAVVNIAGGNDLTETGLISTTAISAAATASNVIYSTTARTNVAYRVIGYIESTQATAGTWATAPSTIQGYGGQALAAMSSLGYGQTWQLVTGSRVVGTTYYNTTGKPITVLISNNGSGSQAQATVSGANILTLGSSGLNYPATFVVPPGASYVVSQATPTVAIAVWAELR